MYTQPLGSERMKTIIWSICSLITLMKIIFIVSILTACGTDKGSDSPSSDSEAQEKSVVTQSDEISSIALDSKSELPSCDESNATQLAYILDEDTFYVCRKESWSVIDLKGKDGVTTTVQVEVGNKANQWIDSVSGLSWQLGGVGTIAMANAACLAPYRLPTKDEASDAVSRGIRLIAIDIGANPDFWTSMIDYGTFIFMSASGGVWQAGVGSSSTQKSVFCVK